MRRGVSYFGNRIVRHFEEDLEDMKQKDCNLVIHAVSEGDLEYYKDTMKDMIKLTKEKKMEVWASPWKLCGIFGGETYTKKTLKNYRLRQVNNQGINVPALCLNKKGTKKLIKEWVDELADFGVDYILWDEPHFYGNPEKVWQRWCCKCKACRRLYREQYKKEMPSTFTKKVKEFRETSMYKFIYEMTGYAKKKGLKVAVVFTPHDMDNAERISKIKGVDIITADPYWGYKGKEPRKDKKGSYFYCDSELNVKDFITPYTKKMVELGQKYKKDVLMWVQAFCIAKGTEEDVRTAIKTFKELGVDDIAVWGYEGCKHMSYLCCDDSDKVWNLIGEAYRKISE